MTSIEQVQPTEQTSAIKTASADASTSNSTTSFLQPSPHRATAVTPSSRSLIGSPNISVMAVLGQDVSVSQQPYDEDVQDRAKTPEPLKTRNQIEPSTFILHNIVKNNTANNNNNPTNKTNNEQTKENAALSTINKHNLTPTPNGKPGWTPNAYLQSSSHDEGEDEDDEQQVQGEMIPQDAVSTAAILSTPRPADTVEDAPSPSSPATHLAHFAPQDAATPQTAERQDDSENNTTPIIRNTNSKPAPPSADSTTSTLFSMTPRNLNQKEETLQVPRIQQTNTTGVSPSSLPSMLGESEDGESEDEISELDSSMWTNLPPPPSTMSVPSGTFFRPSIQIPVPGDSPVSQKVQTPTLSQLASASACFVSPEEVQAAEEAQSTATSTATSDVQLDSILPPPILPDTEEASVVNQDDGNEDLEKETLVDPIIPQQTVQAQESYAKHPNHRIFFRSGAALQQHQVDYQNVQVYHDPAAGWYMSQNEGSVLAPADVSELSSHLESKTGDPTAAEASEGPSKRSDSDDNDARMGLMIRLLLLSLLAVAIVIPLVGLLIYSRMEPQATATVDPIELAPFVVPTPVPSQAPILPTAAPMVTSPPVQDTEAPVADPVATPSVQPVAAVVTPAPIPVTQEPTPSPFEFPVSGTIPPFFLDLDEPEDDPTENVPTQAPVFFNPTIVDSMPPVTAVWNQDTWNGLGVQLGPIWPSIFARNGVLQATVLDSTSDALHSLIVADTVEDWDASPHLNLTLVREPMELAPTTMEDCSPSPLQIRVCNGNYGPTSTDSRVTLDMYLVGRDIVAVVIKVNDDFGLASLASESALQRNLCHQLGHSFGLFDTPNGCMAENLALEDIIVGENAFLRPDSESFAELEELYQDLSGRRALRG